MHKRIMCKFLIHCRGEPGYDKEDSKQTMKTDSSGVIWKMCPRNTDDAQINVKVIPVFAFAFKIHSMQLFLLMMFGCGSQPPNPFIAHHFVDYQSQSQFSCDLATQWSNMRACTTIWARNSPNACVSGDLGKIVRDANISCDLGNNSPETSVSFGSFTY